MDIESILLIILEITGTAFAVFLAGFSVYKIVTHSNRKALKRKKIENLAEANYYEQYINSLDDDLKAEIDNAVADFNRKNNTQLTKEQLPEFVSANRDKFDYSELGRNICEILDRAAEKYPLVTLATSFFTKDKIHKLVGKGISLLEKGEKAYRKWNNNPQELAKFEAEKLKAINSLKYLLNFLNDTPTK